MLENPIILAALICFLLGLVLSGLVRLVRSSAIASTVLPIIFLTSYVLTYQQVPTFPPVGSTNKIFYIALAAALIGFALDLLPRTANYRKLPAAASAHHGRFFAFERRVLPKIGRCHPYPLRQHLKLFEKIRAKRVQCSPFVHHPRSISAP